ncbi:uncharacterized protein PV07_08749 [Cladophialophora immunda]|uniref:Alcohol dehydrogenase-like N-terminal domain-containing protein n=1 Tax=Cladophialophora immunda TaxID=569365 RepID=A0A0D2C313_9EURO|nr:uncharacterized protein PV07_08749 [Cladophialophora immunda]KIW25583.1 hypothetical protein PV07_08749 [Cladophialophora immunda]OQV07688.1 Alcohol dehydrogenase GroES-like domain-containing protein [Cladophialophora immunda]
MWSSSPQFRQTRISLFGQSYGIMSVLVWPQMQWGQDMFLRLATGAVSQPKLPRVGGHELAGTVVAPPSECMDDFKIGDRVAVAGRGYHACRTCLECRNPSGPEPDELGFAVYCPHAGGGLGINDPGGFQEYAIDRRRKA